jgi:hypothetical protein
MQKSDFRRGSASAAAKAAIVRGLTVAALLATPLAAPRAAVLSGVTMPDSRVVDGTRLVLNGIGLRTYSILGIKIYVAGLYLTQRSSNAESILNSPEPKVLDIRFLRDVDAEEAHKSWRNGFANNCRPPECSVDQRDVEEFISRVPAVHDGDESRIVFTARGARLTLNGQPMGTINDPHFAQVLLRTFLGPAPPTARLKRELLGQE